MGILGGARAAPAAGRLTERATKSLRPHQAYHALCAPSLGERARRIAEQPVLIQQPVLSTSGGTIIDGHARWQVALNRGQPELACIEFDLTDDEALTLVIQHHRGSTGLNDFCRILLALKLEPSLKLALDGAGPATSSNLTRPENRDVRVAVARVAGVSTGNVSKVKQLMETIIPDVRDALVRGDVSVHRAWLWRELSPKTQRDQLWRHEHGRDVTSTVARLVKRHVKAETGHPPEPDLSSALIQRLTGLDPDSTTIAVIDAPGRAIVMTRAVYAELAGRPGQ